MVSPQTAGGVDTVHPHGRGDNYTSLKNVSIDRGSPPRAWGQWGRSVMVGFLVRFTPTGVGTITSDTQNDRRSTVHPHGRGDNAALCFFIMAYVGSPPRAWGQCHAGLAPDAQLRFTPTGVGTMLGRRQRQLRD